MLHRCDWATHEQEITYHDHEWGVPSHDDRHLFESLILEGAQSGLSWITILKKREGYLKAFDNFDARKISQYSDSKINELLNNTEIVRNKLKILATISNAHIFLEIQQQWGSFDRYIWSFVDGRPHNNSWGKASDIPATSIDSHAMSDDLKKKGFKFVGPTICYAFMQSVGMVNDHSTSCFRHAEINALHEI